MSKKCGICWITALELIWFYQCREKNIKIINSKLLLNVGIRKAGKFIFFKIYAVWLLHFILRYSMCNWNLLLWIHVLLLWTFLYLCFIILVCVCGFTLVLHKYFINVISTVSPQLSPSLSHLANSDDSLLCVFVSGDVKHVHAVPADNGEIHLSILPDVSVSGFNFPNWNTGLGRLRNSELVNTWKHRTYD